MKRTFLLIAIAIVGLSNSVNAQEYWNFGVKGGVNFTNMTSNGFKDKNSRTGFHLGVLAEIPVGDRFSMQPEVLYSTQGTEATRMFSGDRIHGEYQLDYIQVPVIAKFYVIDGLALEAGPSFNFLVEEEYDFEDNGISLEQDSELGSTFELGGAVGASYKFNNGFFLNGRYALGFTDAFDDSNFDSDAIKNSGFQLGVGFQF
jgi:hypothetical protein